MNVRKYLATGLLVLIPVVITLWVLKLLIDTMDQSLLLLPAGLQPESLFGHRIPGLGVILTFLIVLVTGLIARNFLGQKLLRYGEIALTRVPVVNSIYSSVKQVSDTLLSSKGQAFRKALLIQYPRAGSWTVAFQTGQPGRGVAEHLDGEHVSVYVPTTPNPTSGFFLMLPQPDAIEFDMHVESALKYIISMGVRAPESRN